MSVQDSFDLQTLNLLASNAFREAFDGRLTYASLQRFIARSLSRKAVSVDEVIDLWSFTIRQSRDGHLESLIRVSFHILSAVEAQRSKNFF